MKTFRVLAELSQMYEVEIEAGSEAEALAKAKLLDISDFNPCNEYGFDDDWAVLENSVEAIL